MTSLVLELQAQAADGKASLPDVLRKARMVAVKLQLTEMNTWIEHELHGYPHDATLPEYRILHGDIRAPNPYNGTYMPVRFSSADQQQKLSACRCSQSIGSLHEVVVASPEIAQMPFSEHQLEAMRRGFDRDEQWITPVRRINTSQLSAIFDAVRNRILDWTLQLEVAGILGEGMTFTAQEKGKAAAMTQINIGTVTNFQGVLGTVSGSTINIDNVAAVDAELKKQGFSDGERAELQQLIAEHRDASADKRPSIAKRGLQWVLDNAEKLGALTFALRGYFGGGEGSA